MARAKRTFIVVVVAVIVIALGYFLYRNLAKINSQSSVTTQIEGSTVKVQGTLPIKIGEINKAALTTSLNKIDKLPLNKNTLLSDRLLSKAPRSNNQTTIVFDFIPIERYKEDSTKDASLISRRMYILSDKNGDTEYFIAGVINNSNELYIPIYIDTKTLGKDKKQDALRLSIDAVFSVYISFATPPLESNGDPFQNFAKLHQEFETTIFNISDSNQIDKFLSFKLVPDALAQVGQCQGNISCGVYRAQQNGVCSNNGSTCTNNIQCLGGTCVGAVATSGCDNTTTSPGNCNITGTGPSCQTSCGSCSIGSCTYQGGGSCTPDGLKPSENGGAVCCSGCVQNNGTGICAPCGGGNSGPTTPVCGNGTCEGPTETNATCPNDCTTTGGSSGGGGNTCSGACFGGLNNCGEVGRQPASGSCSNGELCCGFGVPPGLPCQIWNPGSVNVAVGQTITVSFDGFIYGGRWTMSTGGITNPAIFTAFPLSENHCCNTVFGSRSQTFIITGLTPGSAWLTDRWDIDEPLGFCQGAKLINVVANPSTPTVTITANGTSGSTTIGSGSDVTLQWISRNTNTCTATGGWNGAKATTGSELRQNVTTNTVYTITCTGPNGTVSDSVNVNLLSSTPLPLVNLKINNSPTNIVYVTQSPVIPPYLFNTWFSWTTQNASSCVGVSRPHNYIYPQPVTSGPFPGWYIWDWTKPINQVFSLGAAVATTNTSFYDLTCVGPGGTATDTVQVIAGSVPNVVGDCQVPQPQDPPTSVCAPNPTANGSITWEWAPVSGANQYSVVIEYVPGFLDVPGTATGVKPAAFFNCNATSCKYTTSLPVGTYRSSIIASSSGGLCLPSAAGTSAPYTLDLCPVAAWWQGGAGNILSEGLITSQVPYSTLNFIEDGTSGIPGLVSGTAINTGSGAISSTGWSTNSTFGGTIPTYDDFYAQVPAGTTFIDPGANIAPATLQSGGTADAAGYHWYRHTGDVTITGDVLIPSARKDILFVDGGDVNINGKIQFANRANSFFMVITKPTAGGLKGDIKVRSTVTAATGTPALEGMFCGSHMTTGAGNTPLVVRGSVVLTGGITLERDLAGGNNTEAAEKFVQSPELMYNYPPALTFKRLSWQEVAP